MKILYIPFEHQRAHVFFPPDCKLLESLSVFFHLLTKNTLNYEFCIGKECDVNDTFELFTRYFGPVPNDEIGHQQLPEYCLKMLK